MNKLIEFGAYRLFPVIIGDKYPNLHSTVVLIRDEEKRILVDTGYPTDAELVVKNLKGIGLSPNEVSHVVLTHFHMDHTGNISLFRRAKILMGCEDYYMVQKIYESMNDEQKLAEIINQISGIVNSIKVRALINLFRNNRPIFRHILENSANIGLIGDEGLVFDDTLRIKKTPGHTDGHVSVFCEIKNGPNICIAGDALPLTSVINGENSKGEGLINQNIPVFLRTKEQILLEADLIFPGHDQPVLKKFIRSEQ